MHGGAGAWAHGEDEEAAGFVLECPPKMDHVRRLMMGSAWSARRKQLWSAIEAKAVADSPGRSAQRGPSGLCPRG